MVTKDEVRRTEQNRTLELRSKVLVFLSVEIESPDHAGEGGKGRLFYINFQLMRER